MRSVFPISFLFIAITACNPQWATQKTDAGRDTVSESDADEESADTDLDADEPSREAGGDNERDSSPPQTLPDSEVRDAGAPKDADTPADARPLASDGGCADGHVLRNGACQDIDECFEGTHACHMTAACDNTDGGYDCT